MFIFVYYRAGRENHKKNNNKKVKASVQFVDAFYLIPPTGSLKTKNVNRNEHAKRLI